MKWNTNLMKARKSLYNKGKWKQAQIFERKPTETVTQFKMRIHKLLSKKKNR